MTNLKIAELSGLDQIIMVAPEIRVFSGVQALSENDLGDETMKELPREVVSWGSKRLVNAEVLAPFYKIKKAVERGALLFGSRFLGAYAIPEAQIDKCLQAMELQKQEFEQERSNFLKTYQQNVKDWAAAHPEWGDRIVTAAPTLGAVRQRIRFDLRAWRIQPSGLKIGDGGLQEALTGLPSTALREIMHDIMQAYGRAQSRGYCSQRVRKCIERGTAKLSSMRLIDPNLGKAASLFTDLLSYLPTQGLIDGLPFGVMREVIEVVIAAGQSGEQIGFTLKELEQKVIQDRASEEPDDASTEIALEEEIDIPSPEPVLETSWAF